MCADELGRRKPTTLFFDRALSTSKLRYHQNHRPKDQPTHAKIFNELHHCLPLLTPLQHLHCLQGRVWHCRGTRLRGWVTGAKAGARVGTSQVLSIAMQTWTAATMSTASTGTAICGRGSGATIALNLSTGMLPTLDPSIGPINYLLNPRPAGSCCSSSSSSSRR